MSAALRAVVLVSLVSLGARVEAQPRRPDEASEAARREAARQHFEQGMRFVRERAWPMAVQELRIAAELRPTPAVFFNLGMALREAGQRREAIAALMEFQANPGPSTDPMRLELVQATLDALRASFARLSVEVVPAGAALSVDGVAVTAGESLSFEPGEHAVRVVAEGFQSEVRAVRLEAGQVLPLVIRMAPRVATGRAVIDSDVLGAGIEIDGHPAGVWHTEQELPIGTHRVRVRAPGYDPVERTIEVTVGATTTTHVLLRGQGRSLLASPWFWTAAGVIVVAGTVTALVLFSGTEAPLDGALGHVSDALVVR